MEEYRLLNSWSDDKKRGSSRFDRIPSMLVEEIDVGCGDYSSLIPPTLPEEFTSKDFQKETKLTLAKAQTAVNVLTFTGDILKIGKEGRLYTYKIAKK